MSFIFNYMSILQPSNIQFWFNNRNKKDVKAQQKTKEKNNNIKVIKY